MFIFLLGLWFNEGLKTEIYTPILPNTLASADDGTYFVLDHASQEIVVFQDGQRSKIIGGRGEGPGYFQRAGLLQVVGEHLYVFDLNQVHQFHIHGAHQQTWRTADRSLALRKTPTGWFAFSLYFMAADTIDLLQPENPRSLAEPFFALPIPERPAQTYRLVKDHPLVVMGRQGRFALIAEQARFAIHIFDLSSQKQVKTILRKQPPLPMDATWADLKIKKIQKEEPLTNPLQAFVPSTFPFFREMAMSPENHLWVQTWAPDPNRPDHMVFDLQGNPTTSAVKTYEGVRRVLAIHQNKAIICAFEDDEAVLYELPFNQIDAFVAQHPIDFDWFAFFDAQHPRK